ncbi:FtsX-like permease family protein [Emticicia sp. CRIBPO]|uniref:ABC transporter permease n=1 Tax=Emticicia sp. CRIBPO TaxID=2683258 RepID=UPI0014120AC9|nr:ABC transporter permease [Emticicia sp. CRIBPO]NBA85782.1 FtsX-like permease family protein [Emticicia sp. CRIBPO]
MIKNYFKIAVRNLIKNKAFSAINIFGLSIGIATSLIIMLYVHHELSYDRFNENADRIARVVFRGKMNGEDMKESVVMAPVASAMMADYPEVEDATRLRDYGSPKVTYKENTFKDDKFAYVDPNFFRIFTLPLLKGDVKTALDQPYTVVITQELAAKYFGKADPVGKTLDFKDWNQVFTVTGVIDKVPTNSHFHFDLFGSMAGMPDARSDSWMNSNFFTYILLKKGHNYKDLEAKMPKLTDKYMAPQIEKALGVTLAEMRKKGNNVGLYLQPLTEIHLYSDFTVNLEAGGNIKYVYIFGAIAIFMLLIACINFMNLSTAGASKRAKEVGIRKVLGSLKLELVGQFLLESLILTFMALAIALGLVKAVLPFFNELSGKELVFNFITQPEILVGLLLFGLFVSVLAGSYPAFFLSSFKPVSVLKGKFISMGKSIGLRSSLVVFQFSISVCLIIGTTVVYQQLSYIQNKELGYKKDHLLVLRSAGVLGGNQEVFKEQLLKDPRIEGVSVSGYLPAGAYYNSMSGTYPDQEVNMNRRTTVYGIDYDYVPAMGMKLVSGRNFSKSFGTDSSGVIINETTAKIFGWGKNAVGHTINRFLNNEGRTRAYKVIGVVKDFHFQSFHEQISPLAMFLERSPGLIIKVNTDNMPVLISDIGNKWNQFKTGEPFAYDFMDDLFQQTFVSEQKTGSIITIFAGLTIFVACLGLFGLATFTAEQRIKEIGVRKVLGANVSQIVALLSKDFIKLVLIACLIAFPVGYWLMNKWLQDFEYKISLSWLVFAGSALSAVLVALMTVSYQAIKAALMNPVKSLKSE